MGDASIFDERASRTLVDFGVLIDNTIKGLTCLYEIMSRYSIEKLILKRDYSSIASKCEYPVGVICMWQSKLRKKNKEQVTWRLLYLLKLIDLSGT